MIVGSNPRVCIDHDTNLMRLCKFLDFLWAEIQLLLDFMKIQSIRSPSPGCFFRDSKVKFVSRHTPPLHIVTPLTQPHCPHSWQLPSMYGLSLLPSHSAPLSLTAHTAGCPRVSPAPSSVSLSQPQSASVSLSQPGCAHSRLSPGYPRVYPHRLPPPHLASVQDDHEGIGWRWRWQSKFG